MKKNTSLNLQLDHALLQTTLSKIWHKTPLAEMSSGLEQDLKELSINLALVQAKQDFKKLHSGKKYKNLQVKFNQADELEIQRGYQITPKHLEQQTISIASTKLNFAEIGIKNEDLQDYILQILLQNRIGIHIKLLGILGKILLVLSEGSSSTNLFAMPVNDDADRIFRVDYDAFFDQVQITYQSAITFSDNPKIEVGRVELILMISSNLELKINYLGCTLNSIRCLEQINGELPTLAHYQKALTLLSQNLNGLNKAPQSLKKTDAFISSHPPMLDLTSNSEAPKESLFTTIAQFFSRNNGTPIRKSSSEKGLIDKPTELFNYQYDPRKIDIFVLYPSEIKCTFKMTSEQDQAIKESHHSMMSLSN